MTSNAKLLCCSRERELGASPASTQLGGMTLWAPDAESLSGGIRELQSAIRQTTESYLSVTRLVLRKLVRTGTAIPQLEDKVFSAVLGSVLRSGDLDTVTCGSMNDKGFRIYIHTSRVEKWNETCRQVTGSIQTLKMLTVQEVEQTIFGKRAYNSWSSASHVLAHLSYRGVIEPAGKDAYRPVHIEIQDHECRRLP